MGDTPTTRLDGALPRTVTETDVVVVGSGAGGMVAALTARARGLSVVVIEKSRYWGGSTARSGGGAWVPNAPALRRAGKVDDPEAMVDYLLRLAGDRVSRDRMERFIAEGPRMMEFLEGQSPHLAEGFFWIPGYPDYHPELGGGEQGHGLWATPIDKRLLGDEMEHLHPGVRRMQLPLGAWITSVDLHDLLTFRWGGLASKKIFLTLARRILRARLTGERIGVSGQALATRLRLALRERGIELHRNTRMRDLMEGEAGIEGVLAERGGRPVALRARRGVILACGGFDHDLETRRRLQPGIEEDWSLGSATNEGDGIRIAREHGAAVDLMEEAWWMPTMPSAADGSLVGLVAERQYPDQFIVNGEGRRFVNEAAPYVVFCQAQLAGHRTGVTHIPAWMIADQRAWRRNVVAGHIPGTPFPKAWKEAGCAFRASTLEELAAKIGVPGAELRRTTERFNANAHLSRDPDFGRGESAYDNYYGDPALANPNLAPVERPPFYAFALRPGDLGTKGGVVTDPDARVLREDGSVIRGLYATGNVSASVMGTKYAGPGATLGPAMTFGYVAAGALAREQQVSGSGV